MKRKLLALLLTLAMMVSLVPTVALAGDEGETENTPSWADCTSCSENEPHMIYTKADLDKIRTHITTTEDGKQVINGYFKLANDIAFDESDFAEGGDFYNDGQGWLPLDGVGWKTEESTSFSGVLDGDEHTISGIISNAKKAGGTNWDSYGTGLFSYIRWGTVKNLTLKNFKLYIDEESPRIIAGALSGYVREATIENVTVLDSVMYGVRCGGIAGYGLSTSFTGCKVENTLIHGSGHCGGIIGQVRSGVTVENCDVDIEIKDLPNGVNGYSYSKDYRTFSGGIWGDHGNGWLQDASRIENVTVKFKYSSEDQGGVGGLIGGCYSTDNGDERIAVTIDGAIVDVDIDTGTNMSTVGGIFGQVTSTEDRKTKSEISNVIVRGKIKSGEHTSTTAVSKYGNTVSAIGFCHGKYSNTAPTEPSNVLSNIYVSITNTGDKPLPAITYNQPHELVKYESTYLFSLENVVFAGQETIDGIYFPDGSSYKNYNNPIETAYGEENSQWLTTIGSPTSADAVSIEDDSIISIDSGKLCGKKLGSTNVVVHVNMNNNNYTLSTIPVTVTRASVDVTMTGATETYDGKAKTINAAAAADATLPADLNPVYSYKASNADDSSYSSDAPVDCGTYTVKVESGSENYELTGTTTATLTITPADLSGATVTPAQNTIKYNGSEIKPDVTVVLNGTTLVADKDYSITYSNNTKAGAATISVTGKGNYTGTAKGTFTISEDAPTVEAKNVSATYDAEVHKVEVKTSSGKVEYYTDAKMSTRFEGTSAAGEHKVYYKVTGAENFSGTVTGYVMLTIAPATLTIKANDQSVRVGGTMPTFSYTVVSGLCGDDKLTTEPTLSCEASDTKTTGTYAITASRASAGYNYTIAYQNGTLTVYRSSSGGSSSSTTTDNVTDKDKAITATVKAETKTATDGTKTTTATVDNTTATKIVEKAVENKSEEIVVNTATASTVTETAAGSATEIALPEKTVQELSEKTEASVTIKSDAAEVTLNKAALDGLAAQAGDDGYVKLVVETVKQEPKLMQVDLKVVTSKGTVSDFRGGDVSITVKLNSSLAAQELACVYINDGGVYHKVNGVKNADGTYTFVTGHFSSYAVMAEDDAEKVIAEQTAKVKELASKIQLKARSVKTVKGNIKVTLTADEDAIRQIEDLGYTVKYKFYRSTKKAKGYKAKYEKIGKTYTNTAGTKGTKYYYKARVMVYDADGTLVAKTALKQCRYACRTR